MKRDQKFDFSTDVETAMAMPEKLRHQVIAEDQLGMIKGNREELNY